MEDYRTAPVDPAMKQLLCFAEKVARDPGQVTPNDIVKLRSEGLSERAILDATHVAGFFSYMNRVVLALGADIKPRSCEDSHGTQSFFTAPSLTAPQR